MRTRISSVPLIMLFGGLILLFCAGCTGNEKELNLIADEYSDYSPTHPALLNYRIAGHLQPLRRILVNPAGAAFDSSPPPEGRYPEGTVFIKEHFETDPTAGGRADFLTVMIKDSDHPQAVAGWIWLTEDGEGNESIVGGKFCISCHQAANSSHTYGEGNPEGEFRDYIFYPPFTKDDL